MASMSEATFWILTALGDDRRHGYAILGDVERLSGGEARLRVATLYSALERMVAAGQVEEAGDEVVDGRARRYYVATDMGRTALEAEVASLEARAAVAKSRLAASPSVREALA